MKNRIMFFLLAIIFIFISYSAVYAENSRNELQIVQKSAETKYLENDQGYISKEIVAQDLENGEVTIELKLSNKRKEETENIKKYDNTEIYLMVAEDIVVDQEKLEKYVNNIEQLCTKIFNYDAKIKIGIIGIKGTISDTEIVDGVMVTGDNDEADIEGSANNAEIVVTPTNDVNTIIQGLQQMNSSKTKYKKNLQAAIKLANTSFTEEANKVLISLYDGVPDIAIGEKSKVSFGGWFDQYSTAEEAITAKHENIATYTRNEILKLKNRNISFILLRPGDTSYDETWYSTETGEKILDFDGSPYVQKLYGTIEKPTYGKMYLFDDTNIDTIITENMVEDVETIISKYNLSNVKIVDYFPQDVIDNFEFSYVGSQSNGTIDNKIQEENKTITWNIGDLKGDEVANVKYKLKLKDMNNDKLLEKVVATNEKIVLTYKDANDEEFETILSSSPKIKLHKVVIEEEKEEPKEEQQEKAGSKQEEPKQEQQEKEKQNSDNTISNRILPNTGKELIVTIFMLLIVSVIIAKIRYKKLDI